jgi:WD40 repeat protein
MEETLEVEGRFYLEEVSLTDTTSSKGTVSPLPVQIKPTGEYAFDDLEHIQRLVAEKQLDEKLKEMKLRSDDEKIKLQNYGPMPEMIDDFIRNYFRNIGLNKTLASFQSEWFELEHKGLTEGKVIGVPSVYQENQQITKQLTRLKHELDIKINNLNKIRDEYSKLKKERDYHKMHHLRLEQEKSKLISNLKWTKNHYQSYPPALEEMRQKYEVALKEKMLIKLERDRAVGLLASIPNPDPDASSTAPNTSSTAQQTTKSNKGPTQTRLEAARNQYQATTKKEQSKANSLLSQRTKDTQWPTDQAVNPALLNENAKKIQHQLRNENGFWAHDMPISWIDFHPTKHLIATSSDDRTWQMMNITEGEVLVSGKGHTDWLSCVKFSPNGEMVATSGGDRSVRIWNEASCAGIFDEHTQATWGVSWHTSGSFLASCSMDSTSKIWDLGSHRCRNTLRGHANAVMSVEFVHGTSTLLTASSDKTLKLWDARTGLCHHTFSSHQFPLNSANFTNSGNLIASVDSNGFLKFWDVRVGRVFDELQLDSDSHVVKFDQSDSICAVGCGNGSIEVVELSSELNRYQLNGHTGVVNGLHFDPVGNMLASASSDGTVKLWN